MLSSRTVAVTGCRVCACSAYLRLCASYTAVPTAARDRSGDDRGHECQQHQQHPYPVTQAHKRIASEYADNPPALREKGEGLHDKLLGQSAAAPLGVGAGECEELLT